MKKNTDYEFKIILLGESGVGKTSLANTYNTGRFNPFRKDTIVADFTTKELCINGMSIKLCIWDTAGHERFKSLVLNYFRGVDGVLLVYDTTDPVTFNTLSDWLTKLKDNSESAVALVVGNKIDHPDTTDVSRDVAMRFATDEHMEFMECSAKNGDAVIKIFEHLTLKILQSKDSIASEKVNCAPSANVTPEPGTELKSKTEHERELKSNTEHEPGTELKPNSMPKPGTVPKPDTELKPNTIPELDTELKPNTIPEPGAVPKPNAIPEPGTEQKYGTQRIPVEPGVQNCPINTNPENPLNHQESSASSENGNRNYSEASIEESDDDDIEQSFVFVSFLPPVVPLPDCIPLLQVGRRRTSADSVLSLIPESETNGTRLRAETPKKKKSSCEVS